MGERILVCGSRDFENQSLVSEILFGMTALLNLDGAVVIDGECPYGGVDLFAHEWAKDCSFKTERYPADWDKHGRIAGPIRNQQMLGEGKPTRVIAITNKPLSESKGTQDMVTRARKAGLPVVVIEVPATW